MIVTYQNLHKIRFPIYRLPNSNWDFKDGLTFIDNRIVDDRNMPGDTIGFRRLQTPFRDLQPLKGAINDFSGLLKQTTKYFIDTNGVPFIYQKTKFCKIRYHRIKRIDKKEVASLLWIHNINFPFKIPRPPELEMTWAGILYLDNAPWILYDYSTELKPDIKKKI